MLGFADVQADRRVRVLRRNPFKQLVELLERIGLQAVEIGIQFISLASAVNQRLPSGRSLSGRGLLIVAGL